MLNKGDLIKCADENEAIRIIKNLTRCGIPWDVKSSSEGVLIEIL